MFENPILIQETVRDHVYLTFLILMGHEGLAYCESFDVVFDHGALFSLQPDCIMCKLGTLPRSSRNL